MDTSTHGSWTTTYGSQGHVIPSLASNLPAYASFSTTGAGPYVHTSEVNPAAALTNPGGGTVAAEYYDPAGFSATLNLTDGKTHQVALYLADYDGQNRVETVQAFGPGNVALTAAISVSSFTGGVYLIFNVSGDVTFQFTHVAGGSAVLSGLFIDT